MSFFNAFVITFVYQINLIKNLRLVRIALHCACPSIDLFSDSGLRLSLYNFSNPSLLLYFHRNAKAEKSQKNAAWFAWRSKFNCNCMLITMLCIQKRFVPQMKIIWAKKLNYSQEWIIYDLNGLRQNGCWMKTKLNKLRLSLFTELKFCLSWHNFY